MNKCPVCNKPLKTWYVLGGETVLDCSDILCSYRPGRPIPKPIKTKKPVKTNINSWI